MIKLEAPDAYWETPPAELAKICNGMGAASWPAWLRAAMDHPAFCYGVCLRPAADIHDFDTEFGETEEDRIFCAKRFGRNMITLVRDHTAWWNLPLRLLRLHRTKQCYLAVRWGGRKAFWEGKEKPV